MVNQSVINNLKSYLDLLRKNGFPVHNLILYGSQAKGTASDESDIDVLVISPLFDQNPRARVGELWRLTMNVDTRIEPIPVGVMQFLNDDVSPLLESARKEGIAIN